MVRSLPSRAEFLASKPDEASFSLTSCRRPGRLLAIEILQLPDVRMRHREPIRTFTEHTLQMDPKLIMSKKTKKLTIH